MSEEFRPAALLLHGAPGQPSHYDLLLSTTVHPGADDCCALCWRSATAIHALLPGQSAPIEPLSLHRGLYLTLEAPRELDRDRGVVEPLVHGRWRPVAGGLAELCWNPHAPAWTVRLSAGSRAIDPFDGQALGAATRLERLR